MTPRDIEPGDWAAPPHAPIAAAIDVGISGVVSVLVLSALVTWVCTWLAG